MAQQLPTLPREIIREILLFRCHQSFYDKLKALQLDEKVFASLLKNCKGIVFGSFVLSCILDNDNFNDIDILTEKIENNTVRKSIKAFELLEIRREIYEPRYICKVCGNQHLGDKEFYLYTRKHFLPKIKFDFTESSNPKEHLKLNSFNTDFFYFDGKQFCGIDNLVKFICFPAFKIQNVKGGIDFEMLYDAYVIITS